MKYRLFVSMDCGIHYGEVLQSENPEDFIEKIEECERDMLRWVVKNENNEITHMSSIHRGMLTFLEALHRENTAARSS